MTLEDAGPDQALASPLDERASVAVGGLLTVVTSYVFGVAAVPVALFLLRDRIGRRAAIWGSLGSACVAAVIGLGPAWQWWRASGDMAMNYPGIWSIDPSTFSIVLPFVAAVLVLVLCLVAMNRRTPEQDPDDEAPARPEGYRPFKGPDLLAIAAALIYFAVIQPAWFF
jgi:hypothetical protein